MPDLNKFQTASWEIRWHYREELSGEFRIVLILTQLNVALPFVVLLDFLQALRWGLCLLGAVICSPSPWEMIYSPIFWEGCWELGDLAVTHFGSQQWPHSGQFFLQGQTISSDWSLLGAEDQSPSIPAGRSLRCPVTKLPMGQLSPSCDSISAALLCHLSLLPPCPWDIMVRPQEEVLANFLNADLHSEPALRKPCCNISVPVLQHTQNPLVISALYFFHIAFFRTKRGKWANRNGADHQLFPRLTLRSM